MQDPEVVTEVAKVSKLIDELDQSLFKLRNENVKVALEWSNSLTEKWVVQMGNVTQRVEYDDSGDKVRSIKERLTGIVDD
ncbi:uncharacterized protein METZ01_LOCUS482604 [marine metagenome]|uniref:Uncharacterized protein n=1 Tax=marine metagenome TaxID=408172 RepID=A0A383CCB0_9ZZZZ